ncbi:ribonuclease P protein component [Methylobacterium sp. BTF04]|uniref:ribonuclease P protein component n=1 Tax=Methylobacterium sp. BTF04 TaxID=2708300 RepID=UPI0013D8D779|nr:ribonuclease P protein component [Methylobacterium sp. BTF04]
MSTIGRLTRRSEFLAAASGRRFHNERMSAQGLLRGADAASADGLRIGFTITKRVGHATERNRIRRRLRAALTATAEALPVLAADVVLVARRPALHASFDTLIDDLRRAVSVVTKPQPPKSGDARPPSKRPSTSGRGRGKAAAASAGGLPTPPLSASNVADAAATGTLPDRAHAPSPHSNVCDGPTDG